MNIEISFPNKRINIVRDKNIIAIDGGDFTGKTSVIDYMIKQKSNFYKISNPGTTELGVSIRELVKNKPMHTNSYKALFNATEIDIFNSINKLKEEQPNNIYVFDRFWYSSIVYQCVIPSGFTYEDLHKNLNLDLDYLYFSDNNIYTKLVKLYNEVFWTLTTKLLNEPFMLADTNIILVAKDYNKTIAPRINRELDLHELSGIEEINKLYNLVPLLVLNSFKHNYNIMLGQYIINKTRIIEIDNLSVEEIYKRIMFVYKQVINGAI